MNSDTSIVKGHYPSIVKPLVVFLAAMIALIAWGVASPLGATPDEEYHLASIWCGQGAREGLCEIPQNKPGEVIVPRALNESSSCFAFQPDASASCSLAPTSETVSTSRSNADGGYPPVFYWVMSFFASENLVASVLLMRAFNAVLFVAMFASVFFLVAQRLKVPAVWGFVIVSVPLGLFLIPSVNPSSWAIISAATVWVGAAGFFSSVSKRRMIFLAGLTLLATVIGAGARSDAAVYAVLAIIVAIITQWKFIARRMVLLWLPAAASLLAFMFFFTSGQSTVVTREVSDDLQQAPNSIGLVFQNLLQLPSLWVGGLGTWGLGWLDTYMPAIVWVPTVGLFFSYAFAGLKSLTRTDAIAVSIVGLALIIIPLYVLVKDQVAVGSAVQPRYIYPLLILLAGRLFLNLRTPREQFSSVQLYAAVSALTVAQSIALHTNMRRYITGEDGSGINLETNAEWWWDFPVSPNLIWLVGSLSFAIAVFSIPSWTARVWRMRANNP